MNLSALRHQASYDSDPAIFLDQAIFLARASELAYSDDADWIAQSLGLPSVTIFPDVTFQPLPNTQGFWFQHEGIAALVFRGSANRDHWLSNFKVRPPQHSNHAWGTAHPGFLASLQPVVDPVLRTFAAAAEGTDIVWLSGHSLGGALAVLTAAWLNIEKGVDTVLLTYGQPMPGFDDFRTRFDTELPGRLTRLINQSDIVPRLPGVGYAHCGSHKTITSSGDLQAFGGAVSLHLTQDDAIPADTATFQRFITDLEHASDDSFALAQAQGIFTESLPWFAHHDKTQYVLRLQSLRAKLS